METNIKAIREGQGERTKEIGGEGEGGTGSSIGWGKIGGRGWEGEEG